MNETALLQELKTIEQLKLNCDRVCFHSNQELEKRHRFIYHAVVDEVFPYYLTRDTFWVTSLPASLVPVNDVLIPVVVKAERFPMSWNFKTRNSKIIKDISNHLRTRLDDLLEKKSVIAVYVPVIQLMPLNSIIPKGSPNTFSTGWRFTYLP